MNLIDHWYWAEYVFRDQNYLFSLSQSSYPLSNDDNQNSSQGGSKKSYCFFFVRHFLASEVKSTSCHHDFNYFVDELCIIISLHHALLSSVWNLRFRSLISIATQKKILMTKVNLNLPWTHWPSFNSNPSVQPHRNENNVLTHFKPL